MKPRTIEEWFYLVEKIKKAEMLDLDPKLYMGCKIFWETYDYGLLEEVIDENPWIIAQAYRNAAEIDEAEKECPLRPFPEDDELVLIDGKYKLGYVNYNLDQLGVDDIDFTRGMFITGGTGSGKTYPVMRLLQQILSIPREERDFNVIIIQAVKNDFDPFAMNTDLKVLDWKDLRYNMWEVQDWDTPEDNRNAKCNIFANENFLLAHTIPALRHAVKICYERMLVDDHSQLYPTFEHIKDQTNAYFKDNQLNGLTFKDANERLHNRLIDHIDEGEILNVRCGFPTEFFMTHDLCINAVDVNEYPLRTTILSILYDIQRYLTKYPDRRSPSGMRTLVIVDEARWLFHKEREKGQYISDKILTRWFTTARETGFGRIIITQEPESVADYVIANCAYSLTFPAHGKSHDTIKRLQNLSEEQAGYLFKLPKFGEGIFRYPGFPRPILIQIPSDLKLERSTPLERIANHCKPFIERAHEDYVSSTITIQPPQKQPVDRRKRRHEAKLISLGMEIMDHIDEHPFESYTGIRDTLAQRIKGVSNNFAGAVKFLKEEEYAEVQRGTSFSGGPNTQFIVSMQGIPKKDEFYIGYNSPTHFKHSLYIHHVWHTAFGDGFSPDIEYSRGGHFQDRIDVYVDTGDKKVALEIELQNMRRDIIRNIHKCIYSFGVDRLIIITESGDKNKQRIEEYIEKFIDPSIHDKIQVITIQKFLTEYRSGIWE